MPVVSVEEVKTFLGISGSASDAIITALIPHVQRRLVDITDNNFLASYELSKLNLAHVSVTFDATARSVTASSSFETAGFVAGDEIVIEDSYRNDGWFTLQTVSGYYSVIYASTGSFVSEVSGASATIAVVDWPDGLKPIVSAMIKYDMDVRPEKGGAQSESYGDYSVSYWGDGFGYPQDIVGSLAPYMRPRFA